MSKQMTCHKSLNVFDKVEENRRKVTFILCLILSPVQLEVSVR